MSTSEEEHPIKVRICFTMELDRVKWQTAYGTPGKGQDADYRADIRNHVIQNISEEYGDREKELGTVTVKQTD